MDGSPGNTALLVIDMFSRFDFPDAARLAPMAVKAATEILRLREHCDSNNWPVIYANDNFSDWKLDFQQQVAQCLRSGGPSARIAKLLSPKPDHYFILKPKHSAFLATPLPILLAKLGVRRLWLSGMTADSCVLATALDANAREYEVHVAREATAGQAARKHRALQTLSESKAASVASVAALLRNS